MNKRMLAILSFLLLLALSPVSAAKDPFSFPVSTVILDAGHGGHDPGATASYSFTEGVFKESDLVLDITKQVHAHLSL